MPDSLDRLRQAARALAEGGAGALPALRPAWRPRPPSFPIASPTWPGSLDRPRPRRRIGVDFDTGWSRTYAVRVLRAAVLDGVTRPLVRIIATPDVQGLDRLDGLAGPVIFAANHASHLDTPLLLSCLPERFRHRTAVAAASDYFFDRTWKAVLSAGFLGGIPVERLRVSRRSAELARELLEDGWNLLIFPEGGRSPDGWGRTFLGGAAYLAERTAVPIVPVYVHGTREVVRKGRTGVRRAPTTVMFGPALRRRVDEGARELNDRIERAVGELADWAKNDWWSARRRASSGTTPSLHGPEGSEWRRAWALPARSTARSKTDWPPRPGR